MALSAAIALVAMWGGIALSYAFAVAAAEHRDHRARGRRVRACVGGLYHRAMSSRVQTRRPADDRRRSQAASSGAHDGSWVTRAEATLAAAGHKRGGARRALLELLDDQPCALTAVEIEDALRAGGVGGVS